MEPLRSGRRNLGDAALDTPVDGEHCSPARAVSAAGGAWPPGAARAVPPHGRPASRSAGRGRSHSRWRTVARSADSGAGEEPEPHPTASQPPDWGALDNRCPLVRGSYWHVGTSASPSAGPRKRTKKPGAYRGFLLSSSTRPSIPTSPAPPPPPPPPPIPLPPRYAREDAAAQGMILDLMVQIPTD
jgi:hypothetical protein